MACQIKSEVNPVWVSAEATYTPTFYSVERSVGAKAANWTDDVMLVQYFLRRIFSAATPYPAPGPETMKVDGVCGPTTSKWIKGFQALCKASLGEPRIAMAGMVADGIVSPLREATWGTMRYTIAQLNRLHISEYPDVDIKHEPDMPPRLRAALAKVTVVETHGGGL